MARYAALPFSSRVWEAFFANAVRLAGVKRIDRRPYATHPTRMALTCLWLADDKEGEDAAVLALLHDYLEESGGITASSFAELRQLLPAEPLATLGAVLLSEPDIAYEQLGPASERSVLRRVAYVVQAHDALLAGAPPAFADASLVDKLDNLHDLGYLMRDPNAARRATKLAQRVAFFALVHERLGAFATVPCRAMLTAALAAQGRRMELGDRVEAELALLRRRLQELEGTIRAMTTAYQRRIGMAPVQW